jgi:ABC-2 type transport system ATP-binding protein
MLNLSLMKVLEIKNLTKKYGDFEAVHRLNFSIHEGQTFGFLGPNGAGKSTTIRSVMNFITPSSGEILIFGQPHTELKLKDDIGYLSGDVSLYKKLTVAKTIKYFSNFCQVDKAYLKKLIKDFKVDTSKRIGELSKGNRQKIGLILSLMNNPKLLIIDEPTDGLDPLMQEVFYQLINDRRSEGKTTFMSSHNMSEVQKVCTDFAFINKGKLIDIQNIAKLQGLASKKYHVKFKGISPNPVQIQKALGITNFNLEGSLLSLSYGDTDKLIKFIAGFEVLSFEAEELNLDDLFLNYYNQGDEAKS